MFEERVAWEERVDREEVRSRSAVERLLAQENARRLHL